MPKKGEFIREEPATRKRRPNAETQEWMNRIVEELTRIRGNAEPTDASRGELAKTIAAMFDAGARDNEVAAYLEHSLAVSQETEVDWLALATTLHRLAVVPMPNER
jgi:hypothetical protein